MLDLEETLDPGRTDCNGSSTFKHRQQSGKAGKRGQKCLNSISPSIFQFSHGQILLAKPKWKPEGKEAWVIKFIKGNFLWREHGGEGKIVDLAVGVGSNGQQLSPNILPRSCPLLPYDVYFNWSESSLLIITPSLKHCLQMESTRMSLLRYPYDDIRVLIFFLCWQIFVGMRKKHIWSIIRKL